MRAGALAGLFAAALVLGACGDDDNEPTTTAAVEDSGATDSSMDHSDPEHDMEHGDHGEHDHGDDDAEAAGFDDGGLSMLKNGHHADMVLETLSADDQAEVDRLLAITGDVVAQYPTLGVAIDAGASRAGPFAPGLGIHYLNPTAGANGINPDGVMDDADMRNPMVLIFDGTDRAAPIAGFMYYSMAADEPVGFPGPNDFWHYHTNICNQPAPDGINAPLGADQSDVTKEACEAVGGTLMEETQWMVHVWTVPGYEMTDEDGGVFGEVNPGITCADGTYFLMPESEYPNHPKNACRSELENATS